jgi:tetratricopeptide (TPR) repeat protein
LLGAVLLVTPPAFAASAEAPGEVRAALTAGDFAAALGGARALSEAAPDSAAAWSLLAEVLAASGRYRDALDAYQQARALAPELALDVAMARLHRLLGETPEARLRLQGVIDQGREPSAPSARDLIALGDAYADLASEDPALYSAALDSYEAAIRAQPDNPRTHVAIGTLLLGRYNNTEALEAFRAALALEGDYLPALFGLARSQRFDHSPDAEHTLRRILRASPGHLAARTLLARLLIDSEHYAEAEDELRQVLALNPRSPPALAALAAINYLRGQRADFELLLRDLRQATPGYGDLYQTLAEVAGQNRRYRDAARFAVAAVALNPSAWSAHALLGQNRLRLGDIAGGRSSLEIAFRGDPYDARTKNTLDLLDRLQGFETRRSPRFTLVAAAGEADVLAPRLLPLAERAFDFFVERYGHEPPTPIRIEIYPRHQDFSVRTVGLVGVDILGVSFGPVVALDSPSAGAFGPFNWASVLWHEIAHSFHLSMTHSRVPRWFTEGLAVYEERQARRGWGADVSPGFLRAFEQGRLAPPSDLNQAFLRPTYAEQIPHAYYQASLLMEMIERRHGFGAIVEMLQGYAAGQSTAELLQQVLQSTPAQFDAEFDGYVRGLHRHALLGLAVAVEGEGHGGYPGLLARARAALQEGDTDLAARWAAQALRLFPEHGGYDSAYGVLAQVREQQGDVPSAVALLEAAIGIDADDLQGHLQLLRLYQALGDRENAVRTIERSVLIQPFDQALYQQLAELQEAAQQWRQAARSRAAVVALDPTDLSGARFRLARALNQSGDIDGARRELLRTLEQAPLYEDALELLLRVRERRRPAAESARQFEAVRH